MNEHDSGTIAGILEEMGYTATVEESEADIILLNTCAIRENAEDKSVWWFGQTETAKS